MGAPGEPRRADAPRRLRSRGRARRRGDRDPGAVPVAPDVVLYHADGCHLCADARAELGRLQEELGFELREVAIDGDAELESRYRERIPVVALDGVEIAEFFLFPGPFRQAYSAAQSRASEGTS